MACHAYQPIVATPDMAHDEVWRNVTEALTASKGVQYDGCHKIYLIMDDAELDRTLNEGVKIHQPDFNTLYSWFDDAPCGLQFITAVSTAADPNDGFVSLIPQCFFAEDDKDEDETGQK